MMLNFYSSPTFERNKKGFSKKYQSFETDFDNFIDTIETLPYTDLGNNIRKYRLAIKAKGRGISGGFRIISLDVIVSENQRDITFLMVYDKSEHENISISSLRKIIASEL